MTYDKGIGVNDVIDYSGHDSSYTINQRMSIGVDYLQYSVKIGIIKVSSKSNVQKSKQFKNSDNFVIFVVLALRHQGFSE